MKKLFTLIATIVLAAGLSFAQAGGSTGDKSTGTGKTAESGKKAKTESKSHSKKGGKKSKKSSGGTTTTQAPK